MAKQPKSEIMTAEETCRYLKITQRTLYRYLRNRQIPAFKLGKNGDLFVRISNSGFAIASKVPSHRKGDRPLMFAGEYLCKVDEKGRFIVPSPIREQVEAEGQAVVF